MRAGYLTVAAALVSLLRAGHAVRADQTAAGLWQSIDEDTKQPNAWLLIRDHDNVFDGTIVKMYLKPGERADIVCDKCADDRHNKPWLGLNIIRGMKHSGAEYTDGTILDPRDGNIYSAKMTLTPKGGTLEVGGFLGISLLVRHNFW